MEDGMETGGGGPRPPFPPDANLYNQQAAEMLSGMQRFAEDMQEFQYNASLAMAARLEQQELKLRETVERLGQRPPPSGEDEQLRAAVRAINAAIQNQDTILVSLADAQQTARAEMREQLDAYIRESQMHVDRRMSEMAATQFSTQLRNAFREYMKGDHRVVSTEVSQSFAQLQQLIQEASSMQGALSASVGEQLSSIQGHMTKYSDMSRALQAHVMELTGGIQTVKGDVESLGQQMLNMGAGTAGEPVGALVPQRPRRRRGPSRQQLVRLLGEIWHSMHMVSQIGVPVPPMVLPELPATLAIEDARTPARKRPKIKEIEYDDDGPRPSGVSIVV